ncbi:GH12 family glycosyl hydrolase domain-containing protein [Ningiella sp. W23]|uniref:GH12 family glycosyl hydrolase domain-containing protein n=1 Tax=Ningiella sp. W23 TaxID=3023715 RepID=UPI003757DCA9
MRKNTMIKSITTCIILLLTASLLSCSENKQPAWIKPDTYTISCGEYYSHETPLGILNNNVWNKHAADTDSWEQCLEMRSIDGNTQYGWSWSWPFGRRVIYSQPQIKIGASPWAPEPKFNDAFPIKISELTEFTVNHELEVYSNGNHNNVTTMWLLTQAYHGSKPRPDLIAVEVMIWTYATPAHFDPAGKKYSELTIGDSIWEVWYEKDWNDKSGVNDNQWISLSYRADESSMSATIPALKLLQFAISEGLINDELFIADIELGNEVMSGSGIAWVREFSVAVH